MDAMENPVLEPRAERIARYKAERRRELAERFGGSEELPSKWVRRNGKEVHELVSQSHRGLLSSDGLGENVNGRATEVINGVEMDAPAEANHVRRQGYQDSAGTLSREGHLVPLGHNTPQLHTRVSVGQLRSALLQQTDSGAQPDKASSESGRATSSLDLAVKSGSDGGRRRTRRYLPGGPSGSRKTSERFRTQPITANEMEESSGLLEAEVEENRKADVKTDDRANMSVAAKMSLFKELEKSAAPEASALLRPRPAGTCHEHRVRRGNDHRFLTQPITCEELVAVSSDPTPVEDQCEQPESVEDDDESCKMSMSEKLALFNKLSLPSRQGTGPTDGPPERRRQKGARYRTQPITVEEVSLLQKGPIQLPAFGLSTHLSDRQQALSVNLKPSEVRLSQPKNDAGSGTTQSGSTQPQSRSPEPALKGILKKSRSAGSEWSRTEDSQLDVPLGHETNGGGGQAEIHERMEGTERQEVSAPPRRERRGASCVEGGSGTAAPWRPKARNRRETVARTPVKALSEQDAPQGGRQCQPTPQDQNVSSVENNLDQTRRVQLEEGQESVRKTDEENTNEGNIQIIPADRTPRLQETTNTSKSAEDSESPHLESLRCWTNLSFEAQEVSSPSKNITQPQWRQKAKGAEQELQMDEAEEKETTQLEDKQPEAEVTERRPPESDGSDLSNEKTQPSDTPASTCEDLHGASLPEHCQEVKEDMPADESNTAGGGLGDRQSHPAACLPTPCGDMAATESEQDLGVLCQSNTPILTSAVAEHRRAVRPSRRTQGSRNPLRALAAREDIRQDYMGDRVNTAAEESGQAEKKCKNSSVADLHRVSSENVISSADVASVPSHHPFSSLMLIHIKGRQHVQVRLVEPAARSLNSGDCFLLVTPEHCIAWSGEFANEQERAKASELASFIQSQRDLGCRASQVVHLHEGLNSESGVAADFWSLLGGKTQYRGAGATEEDERYELGVVESNCAYRLVENRLVPHEQAWASIPSTSLLRSSEALVFDFGSEVYLWYGRDVSPGARTVALQLAHQVWAGAYDYSNCRVNPLDPAQCNPSIHLRGEGRPTWALLAVVSEGDETALLREKFEDWTCRSDGAEKDASAKEEAQLESTSSDLLSPCDAKALVSDGSVDRDAFVHTVLEGVDVQRGRGVITLEEGSQMELKTVAVDTWHVQDFDDSEIPMESTGQLHEGDSYVVRWTYSITDVDDKNSSHECERIPGSEERTAFFLWRGRHSSASGRDTAAFLSIGMSNHEESQIFHHLLTRVKLDGPLDDVLALQRDCLFDSVLTSKSGITEVVVPQGKEPPCFLQLFQGGLVIHKGKREEAPINAGWRLFCVRGELPEEGLLLEVDCCCAGLRSRGSVILLNSQQGVLFLWTGCKAQSSTKEVSKRAVERISQMCPPELGLSKSCPVKVHLVEEGSEPADFWTALGQMDRKAYDCMLQDPGKYNFTPRLFHLSSCSGRFQAEELHSPTRLSGLVMAMPFFQESLYSVTQPALFLLDNRLEVYLWQRGQPEQTESSDSAWSLWHNERKSAMQTALQYCKELNPRRPPQAYLIFEGSEPLTFTNIFPRWERSLGAHTQGDAERVKLTLVQDALAQLMKTQYPLEELLRSPLPEGVDPQHLEVYLSDQDFQTILEMKRDEYASLPSWKQDDLKKSKGLFC